MKMKRASLAATFVAALLGAGSALGAGQAGVPAPQPLPGSSPNAGTGPSPSIGPNSAQGGPALPGTSLGTNGLPNSANAAPPQSASRSQRCALLSGLERDRCERDEAPASAGNGSPTIVGPGGVGMGR